MIEARLYINTIVLEEVIPQCQLATWRAGIPRPEANNCPQEVKDFINAMAAKMSDFGRIGEFHVLMSGKDLLLTGVKEQNGVKVDPWSTYPTPVPRMVAVDHHAWMHRIYRRQGKQGLINYCRNQVRATDLERTLQILTVAVFKEERTEFKRMMAEIEASKKLPAKFFE
jgi:hypothetical protein